MNEQVWWYASRASGIIAWVFVTLSVVWGLSLSTRLLGSKPTAPWLLDLHRFLGAMACSFTAIHIAGLVADNYVQFGWAEILIPGASAWKTMPVVWGVISFYLLLAIELSSLSMRRLPKKAWRAIHQLSWVLFVLVTVHGLQAGTDVKNPYYRWAALASIQLVFFLTVVRILAQRRTRRSNRTPVPVPVAAQ